MSPIFNGNGYRLRHKELYSLQYVRRYAPGWTMAVAILLFPIGLLALFAKNESTLFVNFETYGSGTLVKIAGNTSRRTKSWLEGLAREMNEKAQSPRPDPDEAT